MFWNALIAVLLLYLLLYLPLYRLRSVLLLSARGSTVEIALRAALLA
jgi:hypothetical protein